MKRKRHAAQQDIENVQSSTPRSKRSKITNGKAVASATRSASLEDALTTEVNSLDATTTHPDSFPQELQTPCKSRAKGKGKAKIASALNGQTNHSIKRRSHPSHIPDELEEFDGSDHHETKALRLLRGVDIESDDDSVSSDEDVEQSQAPETPSKDARRGRPKGRRKRARTPTPPRTLPPHEHYFFQNRPGGNKTSNNTLSSVSLLSHEEYFEAMKNYKDPHQPAIDFLHDMHSDSFDQWLFELEQGFSVCLHGWGSKKKLLLQFAEFLAGTEDAPTIVVLNGFAAGSSARDLFESIATTVPSLQEQKLPANPSDAINIISSALSEEFDKSKDGQSRPIYLVLVHSLDAPSLRRPPAQPLLARLASHPAVSLIASCDTPNFPLLWDISLRTQFNWVFHDATTFASFDAEIGGMSAFNEEEEEEDGVVGGGIVDEVNALLGRSGRKVQGKEGVVFVLRSLTESARRLYSLLIAEVLSVDEEQDAIDAEDAQNDLEKALAQTPSKRKGNPAVGTASRGGGIGIEYRALYRKAVQSLIATSEMQFRQLLKEFYDHEMLTSKKDAMGTELLSLPFRREELETILEEIEIEG